jgi:hypothetical protein
MAWRKQVMLAMISLAKRLQISRKLRRGQLQTEQQPTFAAALYHHSGFTKAEAP